MCTGAIVRFLPKLKGEDDVDEDHLFDDEICWEVREGRRERDEIVLLYFSTNQWISVTEPGRENLAHKIK